MTLATRAKPKRGKTAKVTPVPEKPAETSIPETATRDTAQQIRGLVCQTCGCAHFYVVYTRPRDGRILRRRECRHCGRRITTWERTIGESR